MSKQKNVRSVSRMADFLADGWENAVTKLGTAYASLTHHVMRGETWLTLDELDEYYVSDSVARRVITAPIERAMKKGFLLSAVGDVESERAQSEEAAIWERLEALGAIAKLKEAAAWGRLFGRGAVLLGTSDSEVNAASPLGSVREIKWLRVLRAEEFQALRIETDPSSPGYGFPATWTVQLEAAGTSVETHTSRLILFGSVMTHRRLKEDNEWRDIPILQSVYRDLRDYDSAKRSMSQMLVDASQAVLKISDLPSLLVNQGELLRARLRILELARALRIMPISAGDSTGKNAEEFQFIERTFTGVQDTFEAVRSSLAASVGWPETVLFGRSPAGENATGESDLTLWDDEVASYQEGDLLPGIQHLVDLIVEEQGFGPWAVTFPPLRQLSETEQAALEKTVAETDAINIGVGVYSETAAGLWRHAGDEYNTAPVRLSAEVAEAMRALDEMDLGHVPTDGVRSDPLALQQPAEAVDPQTALNGAQVTAMLEVVQAVVMGQLPRESAIAIISSAFPVDVKTAELILGDVGKGFVPVQQATPPGGTSGQQAGQPGIDPSGDKGDEGEAQDPPGGAA